MMVWLLAILVFIGLWLVADAIQGVAKEMRRANDRREAKKPGTTDSIPAMPESKSP